ncbi:hypothetical protein NM208_g3195 [Fusarium decemcellulare]|uniref:Uncharacterized protein n=1 Tax=Fusarium decemcellulare TaxID=57161 RepID=A0ACC1SPV4_9HYPO|nr:hypothetical protein NM208_g3195 [Fusarium decemcellulare]
MTRCKGLSLVVVIDGTRIWEAQAAILEILEWRVANVESNAEKSLLFRARSFQACWKKAASRIEASSCLAKLQLTILSYISFQIGDLWDEQLPQQGCRLPPHLSSTTQPINTSPTGMEPTEECEDIRSKLKDEDDLLVTQYIYCRWPHYSGAAASGIACLTVVLRAIYARLPRARWEELRNLEPENPLLSHSWLSFGRKPLENHGKALESLAMALWGQRLTEVSKTDKSSELTFDALVNSQSITRTILAQDELRVFQPLLWFREGVHQTWVDYDASEAPASVNARLQHLHPVPAPRAIHVTITSETNLGEEIGKLFGPSSTPSGDIKILLRPAAPAFMYLTATIGGDEKVAFEQLRHFRLKSVPYDLMAIVRYRDDANGTDHVRLYDSLGQQFVPLVPANFRNSYAAGNWGHDHFEPNSRFFLVFVKSSSVPPAPVLDSAEVTRQGEYRGSIASLRTGLEQKP